MKLSHIVFPPDGADARVRRAHRIYLGAALTAVGIGFGLVSLLLTACAERTLPNLALLLSYFTHPLLLALNLAPCVLLVWLGYFLFGRCWCGAVLGAVGGTVLPLINYYKVLLRGDPMLASDVLLVRTAGGIMGHYTFELTAPVVFVLVATALALAFSAVLLRRGRLSRRTRVLGAAGCLVLALALYFGAYANEAVYQKTANGGLINEWSDTEVYLSRGFAVSFLHSVRDALPQPPEGYDEDEAAALLASFDDQDIPEEEKITVMGVMLEAFCDLTDFPALTALETVQEVYAPWHALETQSVSGDLLTNIFAGGTVDTEWSVLTGASARGEYRSDTASYVRYFAAQGYETHYAHPGYNWFYNRRNVNEYLGFAVSTFTENGFGERVDPVVAAWHSDRQLVDFLLEDLDAADGAPLFSFAVSYQNHGPYSEESSYREYVSADALGWSETSCNILNSYLYGISETIGEYVRLTEELEARDTPVVLVLFGDHKPWLGNGGSVYTELGVDLDVSTRAGFYNYYSTPYLIWANSAAKEQLGLEMSGTGGDFSPCFLMPRLFELLGWEGPGFMQLAREMREITPLVHTNGFFLQNGEITSALDASDEAFYRAYRGAEYYREHEVS